MSAETPDYVRLNRDVWTKSNARYTDGRAEEAWAQVEIAWGVWQTSESAVNVLPDVNGKDVVELGCGTAYVGPWLKRRGARRVPSQLDPLDAVLARNRQSAGEPAAPTAWHESIRLAG